MDILNLQNTINYE